MDLFGNAVETPSNEIASSEKSEPTYTVVDKNINNTKHDYQLVIDESDINVLIDKLKKSEEICFDTETTNIDANLAELVGMSFAITKGEAYYVPFSKEKNECISLLNKFKSLFEDESKLWIGQNIKYDLLMLKWYGIEIKGKFFDTMLAHYVKIGRAHV